ncbi:NAD(P)/FAD-dependent oxidoreductase [Variovorax sp. dw_308]|uniref:NAD(P)/FAD-dependent oxidoreductase n=1 Tax=Variovorax sp. dw_308 TaxID=2721546 RepID=UPI00210E8CD3|nr:NAD(P)/FAD-dependent oxidoreductase [Variovorax sp. dw_308]
MSRAMNKMLQRGAHATETATVVTEERPAQSGTPVHRIVIVGGGAGGLELATQLGDQLGHRGAAQVTLIEKARTHFWKPHLHEIAAGTVNLHAHAVDYLAQAHWHGFRYCMGEMTGLDRQRREVHVAPYIDAEQGEHVTGPRVFGYDTLVIAVGSLNNDFGTPGVQEHAIRLETPALAVQFHRRLVNACMRANAQSTALRPEQLQVAIIGAGATGVELAAELHHATRALVSYGLDHIDPERDIRLNLIEAGPRVLRALPERISAAATQLLEKLDIRVRTSARVTAVTAAGVQLANGETIPAELVVWAAGVKAPAFLAQLDGLESNDINQLVVKPTLQTTGDDAIFAIGDCAAAPWLGQDGNVPPRAQVAHQQAAHVLRQITGLLRGKPMKPWRYRDFGSLVSLGRHTTVGNLMGRLVGGNLWIDGLFARGMYMSLYKMHELALHGAWKTALGTAARFMFRRTVARVKLH